jgi:membrane protein YdbS with pleckstrin-like domain
MTKNRAVIHWSDYLTSCRTSIVLFPFFLISLAHSQWTASFFLLVVIVVPLILTFFQNKNRIYEINDHFLVVKEGVWKKTGKIVPFHKINDVLCEQGLIQRYYKAGNLTIMTGNNSSVVLKSIADVSDFNQALLEKINQK